MKKANVAIIGTKFMGKAHSNAWTSVSKFFNVGIMPVLKVACGQDEQGTREFAQRWGWEETASDWKKVVERKDIDIIDVCTPTYLHKDIVVAHESGHLQRKYQAPELRNAINEAFRIAEQALSKYKEKLTAHGAA